MTTMTTVQFHMCKVHLNTVKFSTMCQLCSIFCYVNITVNITQHRLNFAEQQQVITKPVLHHLATTAH